MKTFSKILLAFIAITTLVLANTESSLLSELKSAKAPGQKDAIIRKLTPLATSQSIPALEACAMDPSLGQLALNALRSIPGKEATEAIINVVGKGEAKLRVMAVDALGRRGDPASIPTLEKLSGEKDPLLAETAINALSKIRTPEALAILYKINAPAERQSMLAHARAAATQKQIALASTYEKPLGSQALNEKLSASARMASLRTLLLAKAPSANDTLISLISDKDESIRILAASYANLAGDPAKVVSAISKGDSVTVVIAINALAENQSESTAPALLALLNDKDESIRVAAIKASGPAGDEASARALLPLLLKFGRPESVAADQALRKIKGAKTTEFLRDTLLMTKDIPEKTALISILSDRLDRSILPVALENAGTDDPALRTEAFKAVGNLAEAKDIEKIINLIPEVKTTETRRIWEAALLLAAQSTPSDQAPGIIELLSKAIPNANAQVRPSLLKALASIDSPLAADHLRAMLQSPDINARKANIRALSNIRTPISLEILFEAAEASNDVSEKVLALRGYIDGLSSMTDMPKDLLADSYYKAYKIAPREEEKEACIAQIKLIKGSVRSREILKELQ